MLVNLVQTEEVELRQHLASAIAYCCAWGSNCKEFGRFALVFYETIFRKVKNQFSLLQIGRDNTFSTIHGGHGYQRTQNHSFSFVPSVKEPFQLYYDARKWGGTIFA